MIKTHTVTNGTGAQLEISWGEDNTLGDVTHLLNAALHTIAERFPDPARSQRERTELLAAIDQLEERDYRYGLYMDMRAHGSSHSDSLRMVTETTTEYLPWARESMKMPPLATQ